MLVVSDLGGEINKTVMFTCLKCLSKDKGWWFYRVRVVEVFVNKFIRSMKFHCVERVNQNESNFKNWAYCKPHKKDLQSTKGKLFYSNSN